MKRLLCTLGIFGLLAAGVVAVAASPVSAASTATIYNDGDVELIVTAANTTCKPVTKAVGAGDNATMNLDPACNYYYSAVGSCVVETYLDGGWKQTNKTPLLLGADVEARFRALNDDAERCLTPKLDLEIDKDVSEWDNAAGQLTTFTFAVTPNSESCTDAQSIDLLGGEGVPDQSMKVLSVISSFMQNNAVRSCKYTVAEDVPAGWSFSHFDLDDGVWTLNEASAKATVDARASYFEDGEADINFWNDLDAVPIYVDKTFTGRDYYTTIDRSDFHLWLPGLCGQILVDPFGGLLGSVGIFRTINASQETQIVWALPDSVVAADGPRGPQPCTYRLQENNAPDGCVAVSPDGEDADGPYWEQTWVPGETTAFVFLVVNDCTPPDATPTPTVAPTTAPAPPGSKKGAAQPSGGASTVPKFTG